MATSALRARLREGSDQFDELPSVRRTLSVTPALRSHRSSPGLAIDFDVDPVDHRKDSLERRGSEPKRKKRRIREARDPASTVATPIARLGGVITARKLPAVGTDAQHTPLRRSTIASGTEFDALARAGQLESHLQAAEKSGLYEPPRHSKTLLKRSAALSRDKSAEDTRQEAESARHSLASSSRRRLAKTTLHFAAVKRPKIPRADKPLALAVSAKRSIQRKKSARSLDSSQGSDAVQETSLNSRIQKLRSRARSIAHSEMGNMPHSGDALQPYKRLTNQTSGGSPQESPKTAEAEASFDAPPRTERAEVESVDEDDRGYEPAGSAGSPARKGTSRGGSRRTGEESGASADRRYRRSTRLDLVRGLQVIDLTAEDDSTDNGDDNAGGVGAGVSAADDDDDEQYAPSKTSAERASSRPESKAGECSVVVHAKGEIEPRYVKHPGLARLTAEEQRIVDALTKGKAGKEPLATIPSVGITLTREDFKRLRGVRWLNDELLNAYTALINQRNRFHASAAGRNGTTLKRPKTFVFNTFFYTRLTSSGYDYPGVARWTKRARVDVLSKDLLLIPVNLGGMHWVLAGVDMRHRCFVYLDSLYGVDDSVVTTLRRWIDDEVADKVGKDAARKLCFKTWPTLRNRYMLPGANGAAPVQTRIPRQRDGGSCGVYTAKFADCMEMDSRVYFDQSDIKLVRARMALELYTRVLPG